MSLAVDCAERQLREGTASPSVIVHYLNLGSEKKQLENERLKEENKLTQRLRQKTIEDAADTKDRLLRIVIKVNERLCRVVVM
mgnify:CR=1 FL=1